MIANDVKIGEEFYLLGMKLRRVALYGLNHLNYYPVSNGDKVYVGEKADPILICAYGAETDNVYLIRNDAEVIPSKKDQV